MLASGSRATTLRISSPSGRSWFRPAGPAELIGRPGRFGHSANLLRQLDDENWLGVSILRISGDVTTANRRSGGPRPWDIGHHPVATGWRPPKAAPGEGGSGGVRCPRNALNRAEGCQPTPCQPTTTKVRPRLRKPPSEPDHGPRTGVQPSSDEARTPDRTQEVSGLSRGPGRRVMAAPRAAPTAFRGPALRLRGTKNPA